MALSPAVTVTNARERLPGKVVRQPWTDAHHVKEPDRAAASDRPGVDGRRDRGIRAPTGM